MKHKLESKKMLVSDRTQLNFKRMEEHSEMNVSFRELE